MDSPHPGPRPLSPCCPIRRLSLSNNDLAPVSGPEARRNVSRSRQAPDWRRRSRQRPEGSAETWPQFGSVGPPGLGISASALPSTAVHGCFFSPPPGLSMFHTESILGRQSTSLLFSRHQLTSMKVLKENNRLEQAIFKMMSLLFPTNSLPLALRITMTHQEILHI